MPGLAVADAGGVFRPARGLWVADAGGTYRPARGLSVADGSGAYRDGYALGAAIRSFKLSHGSPSYAQVVMSWAVEDADSIEIVRTGTSNVVARSTDPTGSATIGGLPGTPYTLELHALRADGTLTSSGPQTIVTAALPAPGNVRAANIGATTVVLAWDEVAGASGYDVVDLRTGVTVASSAAATAALLTTPASTYGWAVRARYYTAVSGLSAPLYVTTKAAAGPSAGVYGVLASAASTYQYGSATAAAAWRPEAEGIHHGSIDERGPQIGAFFYPQQFAGLAGGRVTKLEVHLTRVSGLGDSVAVPCRFRLHDMDDRPAGAPALDDLLDTGALAPGESAWIELPADWGQELVNGTASGIAFGGTNGRYIFARPLADDSTQGALRITIG